MRINQVLLVPEFSSPGKEGNFHLGACQRDVVDAYLNTLVEGLDENRVTYSVFREGDIILPNSLIVCLSSGWLKPTSTATKQISEVRYHTPESLHFAKIVCDSISEWGKCYVSYYHRGNRPLTDKDNPFLKVKDTMAVSINPFKLNGENTADYLRWLPKLGEILSECIYDYILSRGEQPRMMSAGYR
jgi:hypothetical protein